MAHRGKKVIRKSGSSKTPQGMIKEAQDLEQKGDVKAAVKVYKSFISRNRGHPQAIKVRTRAAQLSVMLGEHEDAIDLVKAAGALGEKDLVLMYTMAQAHAYLGELDYAQVALDKALAIDPDYAPAIARQATIMQYTGRHSEAITLVDEARARGVDTWDLDHTLGELASKSGRVDEAVERVTERLKETNLKHRARIELEFVLAELLERTGDVQGAWNAVERGNEQRGASGLGGYTVTNQTVVNPSVQARGYNHRIEMVMELYNTERLAAFAPDEKGPQTREGLIYICGMPRSGTTLIEQILSAHPKSESAGESRVLVQTAMKLGLYPDPTEKNLSKLTLSKRTKCGQGLVDGLTEIAGSHEHLVDKLPANDEHVGLLAAIAPGAKIMITQRDPRDIALSCFFRNFAVGHEWTTRFDTIVDMLETHERLHNHWLDVIPKAAPWVDLTVARYEDIVESPEEHAKRLIAHCGMEWDNACLDFSKRKRLVPTLQPHQAAQGVYKGSVAKWTKFVEIIGPALMDRLDGLAERAGYPRSS